MVVFPAISDSLVYVDRDGAIQPGLAVSWERVDPFVVEFELRQGVRFHDGEPCTADDVIASLDALRAPRAHSWNSHAFLSTIAACERAGASRVRVRTDRPDGGLLYRLSAAGAVYPRRLLERGDMSALLSQPVGTGAFMFDRWERGEAIVLRRNPDHWSGQVTIDELHFLIMERKDWIDALRARQLDIAWNVDNHDAMRIQPDEPLVIKRRHAGLSHWFLLSGKGVLADQRVRLALNYAVHRHLLCNVASHDHATPQCSLIMPGQVGYDDAQTPYPYEPDYARELLEQAGHGHGLTLRGLVCESSSTLFHMIRVFLARIGVRLDATIVPRPNWMAQILGHKQDFGEPFMGDFALVDLHATTPHGLLQHALFLHSRGPLSIASDPEYDQRWQDTSIQLAPEALDAALRALDRHAHERALLLYTVCQQVCCVSRVGFDIPMTRTGQPTCDSLWNIRMDTDDEDHPRPPPPYIRTDVVELQRLLDATSYPGTLYETEPSEGPVLARLWRNMELHEIRWKIQTEKMLRTMVELVSATTNLDNVLRSTEQVAILGITYNGRVLFENSGYRAVMGYDADVPLARILLDDDGQSAWPDIKAMTNASGLWSETVTVRVSDTDKRRIFLSVTHAFNENGAPIGYMCIATDHSKEEERLRIRQEMELARRIQKALLPTVAEEESTAMSAVMLPAEEVGGDYYDIITDDKGHTWYGIGDVSGHGVTSGLMMLMSRVIIRALIRNKPDISMNEMLSALNRVLYEDIQRLGDSFHFTVSLVKGLGDGRYVAVGAHEDIIIYRAATGECERIPLTGIWVGFIPEVDGMYEEAQIQLEPGDIMVLYTDGFIEATAEDGSMWETRRFIESIKRHAALPADEMRAAIVEDVREFMDEQHDDMTMMIIRRAQ